MVNPNLHNSRAQESRLAEKFGGRRTPGSGNQWHSKNDVRTDNWSFEAKTTSKKQYILKAQELETGEKYALLDGKTFAFVIEMNGREWVTIAMEDFELLKEEAGA